MNTKVYDMSNSSEFEACKTLKKICLFTNVGSNLKSGRRCYIYETFRPPFLMPILCLWQKVGTKLLINPPLLFRFRHLCCILFSWRGHMWSDIVLALVKFQKLNFNQASRKETSYHFSHVGSWRSDDSPFLVVGIQEFMGLRRRALSSLDEEIDKNYSCTTPF